MIDIIANISSYIVECMSVIFTDIMAYIIAYIMTYIMIDIIVDMMAYIMQSTLRGLRKHVAEPLPSG